MSQGALDRTRFEMIEAYVLDRLTADERSAFERELQNDVTLQKELALQRENIQAVELGGITRILRSIAQEDTGNVPVSHPDRMRYLKYAAAIALLIVGALWWLGRDTEGERQFAAHFVPDPGLPVEMGTSDNAAFLDAMVAYKLGDLKEAETKWNALLEKDPTNDTLRFFMASAALAQGDVTSAIPLLKEVNSTNGSVFQERSRWYLFLAYVRLGEIAQAKEMDLENDPVYGERVRTITSHME